MIGEISFIQPLETILADLRKLKIDANVFVFHDNDDSDCKHKRIKQAYL